MKPLLSGLIVIMMATACCKSKPSERKHLETSNPEYPVELLFEVDSIKVYRFYDHLNFIYFCTQNSRCDWSSLEDKVKKHHSVPTITR